MTKKIRVNKRFYIIVLALVLISLVARYSFNILDPADPTGKASDLLVQIPPNSSTRQIAALLEEQGLIRNAQAFRLYSQYHELDDKIKAGYYLINSSMSSQEILGILVRGKTASKSFTIPEGYNLTKIIDSLANKGLIREQLFRDLLVQGDFQYPFLKGLPSGEKRLEGYLFPETYNVSLDSTEKDIINVMLAGMDRQIKTLKLEEKAQALNLTLHQVVTIASMIEREAKVSKDRALISSVIHNRLKIDMRLQIDATVEYALGGPREKIYYKDLKIDSPYNTYKYDGLPPGPIASPGKESLLAAVTPAKTNYLYYVAKPDGSHAFAKTFAEHEKNKQKYLQ